MADKLNRPLRVWFHYNKPYSKMMGVAVWTVHWKQKCYQVLNIKCNVVTETHERNSQPHAIVRGKARIVELAGPLPEKQSLYTSAYIDDAPCKWDTLIDGKPAARD